VLSLVEIRVTFNLLLLKSKHAFRSLKCEYVFLLGEWHLRTSTAIAKVDFLKSCPVKGLDHNKFGAPRS
jgi:hypothetical protein